MRASGYGYGEPGADVDVTVMAYAQWLSEMKQQATNARYQQQAELDLMRDAINANNGELVDFKRHSSQVVQQLQGQVTELRAKLSDAFAELAQQSRLRTETEQRTSKVIEGLQQVLNTRQMDIDSNRRTWTEQIERLSSDVDLKLQSLDGEVGNIKKALGSSQEQTIIKFGEVDKAMSIFHGNIQGTRQELTDTREDWKKSQDLLGQAISTLSQDLADFQKHASTVMNKLQSDAYHFEELGRDNKDRMGRIEGQLSGIQQSVYSTTNELILLKDDGKDSRGQPATAGFSRLEVPQMRTPQNRRASPRETSGLDGSAILRNESSSGLLDLTGPGSGGGAPPAPAQPFSSGSSVGAMGPGVQQGNGSVGLRPQVKVMPAPSAGGSLRSPQPEAPGSGVGSPFPSVPGVPPVPIGMDPSGSSVPGRQPSVPGMGLPGPGGVPGMQPGAGGIPGMGMPSAPGSRLPPAPAGVVPSPASAGFMGGAANFPRSPTPQQVMQGGMRR